MSFPTPQLSASRKDLMVLVLHLERGAQPTDAGISVRSLVGVNSVAVDPERRQLIVRYDALQVNASEIRAALRPTLPVSDEDTWFTLLPTIAHALPMAAALL